MVPIGTPATSLPECDILAHINAKYLFSFEGVRQCRAEASLRLRLRLAFTAGRDLVRCSIARWGCGGCRLSTAVLAHRQSDPLTLGVDLDDTDLHHVSGLDDLMRILDETVGQLRH